MQLGCTIIKISYFFCKILYLQVLKDEDLRKKYDLYGEDGIDGTNKNQKVYFFQILMENCFNLSFS